MPQGARAITVRLPKWSFSAATHTQTENEEKSLAQFPHINLSITPVNSTSSCRSQNGHTPPFSKSGEASNPAPLCHFGNFSSAIIAHLPRHHLLQHSHTQSGIVWSIYTLPSRCWLLYNCFGVIIAANYVPAQHSSNILPAMCHHAKLFAKNTGHIANLMPPSFPLSDFHINTVNQTLLFGCPLEGMTASTFNTC